MVRGLSAAAFTLIATVGSTAIADEPASDPGALAARRFEEGRRLMAEGRVAEGCAKLEESERLEATGGAVMNLAECYERLGRTASAYALFREGAVRAAAAGRRDIEKLARARATRLEPTLARLTVAVPQEVANQDPELTRDGKPWPRSEWGHPVAVDPGAHTIEARVAGGHALTLTVTVQNGDSRIVSVSLPAPMLGKGPDVTPAPPTVVLRDATESKPVQGTHDTLQTLGIAVGIAGVSMMAAGGIVTWSGKAKRDLVDEHCPAGVCTNAADFERNEDARTLSRVGTGLLIGGAVAAVAGLALLVVVPRTGSTHRGITASPWFTVRGGGVGAVASF